MSDLSKVTLQLLHKFVRTGTEGSHSLQPTSCPSYRGETSSVDLSCDVRTTKLLDVDLSLWFAS